MALVKIRTTTADRSIANAIASHTTPPLEEAAGFLTWGADEKGLVALAVGAWLYAARRLASGGVAGVVDAAPPYQAGMRFVLGGAATAFTGLIGSAFGAAVGGCFWRCPRFSAPARP